MVHSGNNVGLSVGLGATVGQGVLTLSVGLGVGLTLSVGVGVGLTLSVGLGVGSAVTGADVGLRVGFGVTKASVSATGTIGASVGALLGLGRRVGLAVGVDDGRGGTGGSVFSTGAEDGRRVVGSRVGALVGSARGGTGMGVGELVGLFVVGCLVLGSTDEVVGSIVGTSVVGPDVSVRSIASSLISESISATVSPRSLAGSKQ